MVGAAQMVAYNLRVLHARSVLGRAMVRVALGRRYRSSRASQLLRDTDWESKHTYECI